MGGKFIEDSITWKFYKLGGNTIYTISIDMVDKHMSSYLNLSLIKKINHSI